MNSWIDLHALWQIVVLGLLAGAGLPAVFALGVRALAGPASPEAAPGATAATGTPGATAVGGTAAGTRFQGGPLGRATAGLCFAIVLAAVGYGIYLVVAG